MDEIRILTKIRRELKESYQQIGDAKDEKGTVVKFGDTED